MRQQPLTLWVTGEESARDLLQFLAAKQLGIGIRFVPPVYGQRDDSPILFTPLGSFEGESNIRRAVSALA